MQEITANEGGTVIAFILGLCLGIIFTIGLLMFLNRNQETE